MHSLANTSSASHIENLFTFNSQTNRNNINNNSSTFRKEKINKICRLNKMDSNLNSNEKKTINIDNVNICLIA